jgi:chemotaxis methyl-accepting protein methylase/signal transduction histidine kinase/chemotaxis response regulator CheB
MTPQCLGTPHGEPWPRWTSRPGLFLTLHGDRLTVAEMSKGSPHESSRAPVSRLVAEGGEVTAPPSDPSFPVVGIGASAGGLDAFTQLLKHVPPDSGMAFVLIQHLDPTHTSFLCEALAGTTAMPVSQAADGAVVEPDHVYVIPPNADIAILHGRLVLSPRPEDKPHLPVDFFLRALAAERGSHAIGVILSGTASDGTLGLKAIKAADGITFAQDPGTAKYGGMPRSAVDAGVVDFCVSIPDLAQELVRLSRHPYIAAQAPRLPGSDDEALAEVLAALRRAAGVDFTEYKAPSFERRLARRMALRRAGSLSEYLGILRASPDEARLLYEDLLIHVTAFFRDPEVFESLKAHVFPEILKGRPEGAPLRIWVAGCSTGEEVYSLGICLLEHVGDSSRPIQIFGSDLGDKAIERARAGLYADSEMSGVSDERRKRYFTKADRGYRIVKAVRDMCVFVQHDLARDPPFSRLDLVVCRNVLIYFDRALQKRVLLTLHYALKEGGFLLLGRSESISGYNHLFVATDKANKIFARTAGKSKLRFAPRSEVQAAESPVGARGAVAYPRRAVDLSRHLDRVLLARYAPPGVLVNEKMEILQFRGQTGAFLQAAPGEPQSNVVKMARPGLSSILRATLGRAREERAPVRADGVEVDQGGFMRTCNVVVVPFTGLPEATGQLYLVLFEDASLPAVERERHGKAKSRRPETSKRGLETARLAHELSATRQYLETVIQEHGQTNDDLGSANEELVSGNEELQSLNEELETAKEELQSINEELTTVNDELHSRNQEVTQINSDLVNLLSTVEMPVVIVDVNRRIRRFTPNAQRIWNVLPADVGRPLDDIRANVAVPDLDRQIAEVIEGVVVKESEVQDRGGLWYRMQIRPYETADGAIDGAILSLVDIDALKHHVGEAQQARADAERANRVKDQFLATLSHELRAPLSSMLLYAQLVRRGELEGEKLGRAGESIERGIKMQVQLIDDLLDVSRIVTGKLHLEIQPVDLGGVVEAALDDVRAPAEKKAMVLEIHIDHALGAVAGSPVRLQQVVSNLLLNAVKFTSDRGRVTVTLDAAAGRARLTVSDTGQGIEPGFLPHVFSRFTQEDNSSTRKYGGLGLGLAIVHHLVEMHGGTVTAASPGAGKGSTFTVSLPLLAAAEDASIRAEAPVPEGPRSAYDEGRLRGLRVLVVDDDPGTRHAVGDILSGAGADVRMAESAAQGMTAVEGLWPEVLVSDVAMPGEDGYAFIRRVRALGARRGGGIPALALTALAGEEDHRRALAEGFQMHLAKPVDIDLLTRSVVELSRARPRA